MSKRAAAIGVLTTILVGVTLPALAEYDVQVDLKNVSGQEKTDWPVVLKVTAVFGRDLPPFDKLRAAPSRSEGGPELAEGPAGSINPEGYHVYDPAGKEVPHALEVIPPEDIHGNDEIIFVVPKMADGQKLTYRVTNTKEKSALRQAIDTVGSRHNLIANGDFEQAGQQAGAVEGFSAPARQDAAVKHTGKAALALSADAATVSAKYAKPIELHKDSWYYFGVWSKTDNVGRYGYGAGNGAYFKFEYLDPANPAQPNKPPPSLGLVNSQCSTRDWLKLGFEGTEWDVEREHTDWGLDRQTVQAKVGLVNVEFVLEQRRHYYMEPGKSTGTWWLDGAVLLEQPEVNVRFDLTLKELLRDGVFLFDRTPASPPGAVNEKEKRALWCARPFAHEKAGTLSRLAVKGQRATLALGLWHTRPLEALTVRPSALTGPEGATIPLELVEYCPGFADGAGSRWMKTVATPDGATPLDLPQTEGVRYFFASYVVRRDARAGKYAGTLEVQLGGKGFQTLPLALRVQELEQPILRDLYVGLIYQGGNPPAISDEMIKVYGRTGFSSIMWFSGVIPYKAGELGKQHIDADKLNDFMHKLLDAGVTAGCGFYSEVQLDNKPKGRMGRMISLANQEVAAAQKAASQPGGAGIKVPTEKEAYARLLKELDAAAKSHPEWPRIIHMNWDEPPPFNEKMGWTNEILPDAISTLDVQFDRLPRCIQFYNTPAFDDPADWAGPELYQYVKKQGKNVGFCGGAGGTDERSRYQAGMLMITSGATYFHAWHHNFGLLTADADKKPVRGFGALNWAAGMDDLKAWYLLSQTIAQARKTGRNPQAVKAAEDYLAKVLSLFNGDHKRTWPNEPYLGYAFTWGYERFYDDWQEQMLKHAAAIRGAKWVE